MLVIFKAIKCLSNIIHNKFKLLLESIGNKRLKFYLP